MAATHLKMDQSAALHFFFPPSLRFEFSAVPGRTVLGMYITQQIKTDSALFVPSRVP